MFQTPSLLDQITSQDSHVWVQPIPDGAMSVTVEDETLMLKVSFTLQERFGTLLAKRKEGIL